MALSFIHVMLSAIASTTMPILLIALLRKPLRMATGAQAAYWLWLLLPTSVLATGLPSPSPSLLVASSALPNYVSGAFSAASKAVSGSTLSDRYMTVGLIVWAAGGGLLFALLLSQQLKFVRSLGAMSLDANGIWRSNSVVAPMLVGVWHPRIVVPVDFETRYSAEEQSLVLAHERAHLARRDILTNALAAGWLCVSWFNPLMYWAIGWLRMDQELACDALVLRRSGTSPRSYAGALLKTQLATESTWGTPVGCHWQSIHPLKERVSMLKQPLPGFRRQVVGMIFALSLTIAGSYVVWASTSETPAGKFAILVHLKLTVTDSATENLTAENEYIVNSGEAFNYRIPPPYDTRCTARLTPGNVDRLSALDKPTQGHDVVPAAGQILLECMIRKAGEIVATPALITLEGEPATVDVTDAKQASHYVLELTATTSKEKIAAARKATAQKAAATQ
jgi:beta-lactamase regulating signal transducer with metallopeptidase domain